MLFWLEKTDKCPEDSYPFREPTKYVRHNNAKDVRIAAYVCPECGHTYLKYPGAEVAALTNTSVAYLSLSEWDRVRKLRKSIDEEPED